MQQEKIELIRHSCSHLMSMAIMEKYPAAGLGVGPTIEDGFYHEKMKSAIGMGISATLLGTGYVFLRKGIDSGSNRELLIK